MINLIDMSSSLGSTAMLVQRLWAGTLLLLACSCGLTTPASAQQRIGPSFNCGSPAVASQPVAQVICSSDELAYLDLAYVVVHQALLHSSDEAGRRALAAESALFVQGNTERCGLPKTGLLAKPPTARDVACIADRYRQRRAELLQRVRGPAAEEASLAPEDTLEIQKRLQAKGFLPPSPAADGVLGPASRNALSTWQRVTGAPETGGFASKAVLAQLAGETITPDRATSIASSSQASTALSSAGSTPLNFGACQQLEGLAGQVSAPRAFETGSSPILGVAPHDWNEQVLGSVIAWGQQCIAARRREADNNHPRAVHMEGYLKDFENLARKALASRDAEAKNAQGFDRALASEVILPNGARVTCRDLASLRYDPRMPLDDSVFGRPLRNFSDDDFRALVAKRDECAQTLGRLQTSARPAPSFEIAYIRQLYEWRFTKLEEEKRVTDAAAQKQREIAELEEDKRLNPTKLPTCSDPEVVRTLVRLISSKAKERVEIVEAQPRPREANLMPDVYVPADGLYRREGMEWRECLSYKPYEYQGASRKRPILYRITWQSRAKGEVIVVEE